MLTILILLTSSSTIVDFEGARAMGIAILPASGKGLGAFTQHALSVGCRLGSYTGEIYTARQWNSRINSKGPRLEEDSLWLQSRLRRGVPVTGDYILGFNAIFIDAQDPKFSNWCRYINHDSNPNLGLFRDCDEAGKELSFPFFYVIRSCEPGEELSFDYGDSYWEPGDQQI